MTKTPKPNLGGRPALEPGKVRRIVTLSVTDTQRDKLGRISSGRPSEFLRQIIDSYPEQK